MHGSSLLRMEWFRDTYLSAVRTVEKITILDIGSYDVNGSYKGLFSNKIFGGFNLQVQHPQS